MSDTQQHLEAKDLYIPRTVPGFRTGCRVFMHLVSRYTVTGRHNIPTDSSYILISNHMSYFDAPAIGGAITGQIAGFAARKYRKSPLRLIFELGAPVWIEQDSPDRRAITHAIRIIKSGHPFVLAPEGTRSRSKQLIEGKEGAAFLVTRTNVTIVPAAVWGTEKVLRQLRPAVQVTFGKPFQLPPVERARGEVLREYTDRMMCAIAALLPERYHGFYAGHPFIEEMAELVRE